MPRLTQRRRRAFAPDLATGGLEARLALSGDLFAMYDTGLPGGPGYTVTPPDEWSGGTGGGSDWLAGHDGVITPMDTVLLGYPSNAELDSTLAATRAEWETGTGGGETWPLPIAWSMPV